MREIVVVATCDECGQVGEEKALVNIHLVRHENRNADPFEIDLCSTCLASLFEKARRVPKSNLAEQRAEQKAALEPCPECGKEYVGSQGLGRHRRAAHGVLGLAETKAQEKETE